MISRVSLHGNVHYLVTKALCLIAMQTSRKDTSLVIVYPCKTRGSFCDAVDIDLHGVGKLKDSSCEIVTGPGDSSLFRCFGRCEENDEGRYCLNLCVSSSPSLVDVLGSPSQTSISMQRHPRRRTFLNVRL